MKTKMFALMFLAFVVATIPGCGESAPSGERPPEARATPRVIEEHQPEHGPGDGHDHSAVRHGYSADGKPVPHDPQGGEKAAYPAASASPASAAPAAPASPASPAPSKAP